MKRVRHGGRGSRGFAALCIAAVCTGAGGAALLPDPLDRVSWGRHGGDWSQGSCSSRNLQSPITINTLYVPPTGSFEYWYRDVKGESFNFYNDGRTLWADLAGKDAGFVSLPHATAPRYELFRIDVHSPSEHTLRGEHLALELQLVHQPTTGPMGKQLVTVSILFNSTDPPHLKHMKKLYPGLLQQSKKLRASHKASDVGQLERDSSLSSVEANPDLQAFVRNSPPVFQDVQAIDVPSSEPLRLGRWLEGGTFAMYRGSQTLPPCKENVVWLVRREPVMASDAQIESLFLTLYETSDNFGNYRTVMPLNQRPVEFWTAKERGIAPTPAPRPGVPSDAELRTWSSDAITIAKAASDYARDLNARLSGAAVAQQEEYRKEAVSQLSPRAVGTLGKNAPPELDGPGGDVWAAKQIGNVVKQAVEEAVAQDLREVVPAATNLATGYIRKALLKAGGWPTTSTTPVPMSPATGAVAGQPVIVVPIVFTVMVLNVDYAMLTANPQTQALFMQTAKNAVLTQLGSGLSANDISLSLSPGSVVVSVTVKAPPGLDPTVLQSTIARNAGSLATSVTQALAAVPSIMAVSPGGAPTVGDVGAPTMLPAVWEGGGAPAPAFAAGPSPSSMFAPAPSPALTNSMAAVDPNAAAVDPNAAAVDPNVR